MRILVDGDATPDINKIKEIALKYHVEMLVFCDWAHERNDDYYQTIVCEIGNDSVDSEIVKHVVVDDLVITQDYGLAALVLGKEGKVMHTTGKRIRANNIDNLLMFRYLGVQSRKANKHISGPKKRTNKDRELFLQQVEKFIINHLDEFKK